MLLTEKYSKKCYKVYCIAVKPKNNNAVKLTVENEVKITAVMLIIKESALNLQHNMMAPSIFCYQNMDIFVTVHT